MIAAALLLASAPMAEGIATFRCTFDNLPADISTMDQAQQAAWQSTVGASPFKVSFPVAQPEDLQKAELFAFRGDDLTGYAVETGLAGPLKSATGPTEARRLFWPAALRQTLENGPDHWLWVELTDVDLEGGTAGLNLYRQERPAGIRPSWQVTGQCADINRQPSSDDANEVESSQ